MKLNYLIFAQDGMSRGDETYGSGDNFIVFIFCIVFLSIAFLFKILIWVSNKKEAAKDVEIIKPKVEEKIVDKYNDKSKEELIACVYKLMIKKPQRDKFGYDSGANGKYLKAVENAEKAVVMKDKILQNLSNENIASLKKTLSYLEPISINIDLKLK